MRVRPINWGKGRTVCGIRMVEDRRLVFDLRRKWSPYASKGSKLMEASRPSFMFVQALNKTKGSAHTAGHTTKKMLTTLLEGCGCFGASSCASKSSTMTVLDEHHVVGSYATKQLHQRVDKPRSMDQTSTVTTNYPEVPYEVVRCLLCCYESPVLANYAAPEGTFSLEWHGTCGGSVFSLLDDRYLLFHPMNATDSDHFQRHISYRILVPPNLDQSFVFVKAL